MQAEILAQESHPHELNGVSAMDWRDPNRSEDVGIKTFLPDASPMERSKLSRSVERNPTVSELRLKHVQPCLLGFRPIH